MKLRARVKADKSTELAGFPKLFCVCKAAVARCREINRIPILEMVSFFCYAVSFGMLVKDKGTEKDYERLTEKLTEVFEDWQDGKCILFHCKQGANRGAALCACYLMMVSGHSAKTIYN